MKDNIIELKHRKLEHSKQMGILDMNLKPEKDNKNLLNVGFFIFFCYKSKIVLIWFYLRAYLENCKLPCQPEVEARRAEPSLEVSLLSYAE